MVPVVTNDDHRPRRHTGGTWAKKMWDESQNSDQYRQVAGWLASGTGMAATALMVLLAFIMLVLTLAGVL